MRGVAVRLRWMACSCRSICGFQNLLYDLVSRVARLGVLELQEIMRWLKVTIAYDGTHFFGWQVQPDKRTVQQTLEEAIERVTGERRRVIASGRTDAGVHAIGQVVSFQSESRLEAEVLRRALEANTPADLSVLRVEDAPPGFDACRHARQKRYRYVIQDGVPRDVFARAYAWYIPRRLDVEAMQRAAAPLVGTHDFRSFEASGSPRVSTVRTVTQLDVRRCDAQGFGRVVIEIAADGFLYNMVRNIVGSLVAVGRGRRPSHWVREVLQAGDRRLAGPTAPAHGLFLVEVQYDD